MKCPKCGGFLRKLSGFHVCKSCRYRMGSQNLEIDWDRYNLGYMSPHKNSDDQTRPSKAHNPRRRYPLKFEE